MEGKIKGKIKIKKVLTMLLQDGIILLALRKPKRKLNKRGSAGTGRQARLRI